MPATFFIFLFCSILAQAQSFSIYQNITTSNGLPSNYVFASGEDENGFLWVGTDRGLCRYDGFHWQVWDKDNGLPGNYVNTVLPDKKGGLWVGISDKGYYHFDPATGTVQRLNFRGSVVLPSLQTTNNGDLYAEVLEDTTHKAFLFHSAAVLAPTLIFSWSSVLPVRLIGHAKKREVQCLSANGKELQQIKMAWKGTWPLRVIQLAKPYFNEGAVYFISDSVMVHANDYFVFDPKGALRQRQPLFPAGNTYAYTCPTDSGLYVYNIKTGYYFIDRRHRKTFYNSKSGLGSDYVNHIYQTQDGSMLISTLGAGLQLVKSQYRKTYFTDNQTVKTIIPSGESWYVLAGDQLFKKKPSGTALLSLGHTGTSALNLAKWNDTLLVGTLRGIFIYNEKNETLHQTGFLEKTAGVSSIIKEKGQFLAGTYGSGLVQFQLHKKENRQIPYPFFIIEKLIPLADGFAALSYEDGLLLTKNINGRHRQLTQKEGLLSNSVYSLYQHSDTLWIGTKGGINVVVNGKTIDRFSFPQSGEKALASFHDQHQKLWVVSNRGLYYRGPKSLQPLSSFPLISQEDVVTTAAYNAATNELGIGSNKTFSIVALDAIKANTSVSTPRLTGVELDGKPVKANALLVPFDFGGLSFTMAPLSALPFTQNRFFYKLEGLSPEWKEVKDSLTVSFTALRPGMYTLFCKSVNRDGFESKPQKLAFFTVQKPYWLRWPFLLFGVLFTASMTTLLVKQTEKAKRQKKEAALLLQQTVQAERQRIAKDLHDHLGTNLATIIAQTDNIETRLFKGDVTLASQTVQNLSAQSRETMDVLREAIWAVQETEHTIDEFLLRIRTFLQRFFESTMVAWEVKSEADGKQVLSPTQTLHLFRIIQEASQNIIKHSKATKAQYYFSMHNSHLKVVIQDNGQGFAGSKQATNGITNIQERATQLNGKFTLATSPFVTITILLPV